MSETYEKARAIAEAAANGWDKFDDTQGIARLADMIMEFGALPRDDGRCMCPACKDARQRQEREHRSDCAVHSEPAFPAGPCNCGAQEDAEVNRILAMSDEEVIASVEAEGRDPEALAEAMRGQMGATFELCAEVARWKEEARSWRAVAERLETEKVAPPSKAETVRHDIEMEMRRDRQRLMTTSQSARLREAHLADLSEQGKR